jgi:hypothetical protein
MTQQELEDNLKKIAETLEYEMKSIIELNGAIATGTLLNDLSVQFEKENKGYRIAVSYPFYGKFINEGRNPSTRMPPLDAIREWTRIKGIPDEAVYPIAKKIQEEGYKGINFTRVFFGQEERNALKKNIGGNYMDYITTILTKDK